jgi:hypothetical protein
MRCRLRTQPRLAASLACILALSGIGDVGRIVGAGTASAADDATPALPSPESFFGFRMGEDRRLAGWEAIVGYFELIAAASDRVELLHLGRTTGGQPMIAAVVTAPENLARLPQIQDDNRRLADPRPLDEAEAREIVARHPPVVAIGCSIHGSEVGATQTANELLHDLATTSDPDRVALLRAMILVLIPSMNPDGHREVVSWYDRTRGTPFEGTPLPWLDHQYAGHDLNRDGFALNLVETRNLARLLAREWQPQVFLSMHQMDTRGPRFFVPPTYDPPTPNVDPIAWRVAALLGQAMAFALEREGRPGVISNFRYDYYYPGYEDSLPLGRNTVCLLTEAAGAKLATPVNVAASELSGSARGLPEYRERVTFPNPWRGGVWRLRNIVEYELSAVAGLLDAVGRYRREIVGSFLAMGRRAVETGLAGKPYAYVLAPAQHDPHAAARLVNALIENGIEVERALEPFSAGGRDYPAGSEVVCLAQPFRALAKTLLERQVYPRPHSRGAGTAEPPYDVAAWTLPAKMGVDVEVIDAPFEEPAMTRLERMEVPPAQVWGERRPGFFVLDARGNAGATAVNRLLAAGLAPSWLRGPIELQGYRYPSGSVLVPAKGAARRTLERVASTLGLRSTGAKGRPPPDSLPIVAARVALHRPWGEHPDYGWTRLLLERHEFEVTPIEDEAIRGGGLSGRFDVLVLPDAAPQRLRDGFAAGTLPPEYTGGLGTRGIAALADFVEAGGTLVCLDTSCRLAIDALGLPLRDVVESADAETFYCPGSLVRLVLEPVNPLAFGMRPHTTAFFFHSSAYQVLETGDERPSGGALRGPVIAARYADQDLLVSGWLDGESAIAGRAAVVEARVGDGRVVLIGFRAQHRAQADATFRLLFNAILTHTPVERDR